MSIFALHNELPGTIDAPVGTITLSGEYSVINDGSNVNVTNSNIDLLIPSFVINNGMTNVIATEVELPNNIVIDNSSNYIDNLDYFNTKYTFVEGGSLFPYLKVSAVVSTTLFDIWSNTFLLIISPLDSWKNSKKKFIELRGLDNFGTGLSGIYSTHFLNNGSYGYWGNKYGGLITSSFIINVYDSQELFAFLNTIPRNLNGYTITVNYLSDVLTELQINNFYNGTININFNKELMEEVKKLIQIKNNNSTINLHILTSSFNLDYLLYDNKDVNVYYEDATSAINIVGDNNYVNFYFSNTVHGDCNIFKDNCYGNKVLISSAIDTEEYFDNRLAENNDNNGNFIVTTPSNARIKNLINDGSNVNSLLSPQFTSFIIDEVHPKKIRDISDIGTIIGWPAKLPVPRGYYVCNGQQVKVDLNNPKDEFYNGQLAWYMNNDLSDSTISLPNLPAATPQSNDTDPNYYNDPTKGVNFQPVNPNEKLIYIIKYNNNFLNKKKGL